MEDIVDEQIDNPHDNGSEGIYQCSVHSWKWKQNRMAVMEMHMYIVLLPKVFIHLHFTLIAAAICTVI